MCVCVHGQSGGIDFFWPSFKHLNEFFLTHNAWLLGKCLEAGVPLHSWDKGDVPVVAGHGVPLKAPELPEFARTLCCDFFSLPSLFFRFKISQKCVGPHCDQTGDVSLVWRLQALIVCSLFG